MMIDKSTKQPYINVIFGNFYCPGFDDEAFVDETMGTIRKLGFNSVMFDTKAWEDFKERYETGALSQYVKMQEYMGKSALEHGLTYTFLVLYLNGDNLYPHIRFSPPIFGEETVKADGTPGKWYKYWSPLAKLSMQEHVERIMDSYKDGCTVCDRNGEEVIPVCSMWDPIVAFSYDAEGISRYINFLENCYKHKIENYNLAYGTSHTGFTDIRPEEYAYELNYSIDDFFTEEDVKKESTKFLKWRDNAVWKKQEIEIYFKDMQMRLKEKNPELFLCPDLTQWGYFLNIFGRTQQDHDNDFSELWDTSMRGIDIYALSPYVDSCHFITVPTTPDGVPDAYVTSCQHSMMRVMNEGKTFIGGTYWGRFIYNDLYAQLTPAEIIGTMTACGIDGYTSYGINGLDDGGVLNRMEESALESLAIGNEWCKKVIIKRKGKRKKEIALLFPQEMSDFEPLEVGNNKIRRLDLLGWYKICCDLGYQTDVISRHEIVKGMLDDYRILILPANDCYLAAGPDAAAAQRETENLIKVWVHQGGMLIHGPKDDLVKSCFGIEGKECAKMPFLYQKVIIPQGCEFMTFLGESIADYVDGGGTCIARTPMEQGVIYSFGILMGASYTAKNIPHVPYEQNNKEMYPIIQSKTSLFFDILQSCIKPISGIMQRGIETGVFENGMVIINHRSTPYTVPDYFKECHFQYPVSERLLMPHTAVWAEF